ncbi:MAG: alpha/beta fold hydrolase [Anaerolineae bacterium]
MSKLVPNYRVEGEGPPLLLVHGFGISFNIWKELLPFLKPHFSVIMIELPGIGATPMPPEGSNYTTACIAGIDGLRKELGVTRWTVLGYSSGSRITEAYVQAHPQDVCRALFLCPLAIDAHKTRGLRLGLWLDSRMPAIGTWILSGWRLKLLISWLGFNLERDPRAEDWYAELSAVRVAALKETVRAVAQAAPGPFSVPVPYAMIWGDRDQVPMTPRMPGEHDFFVHARHAAPVEAPEPVARLIVQLAGKAQ